MNLKAVHYKPKASVYEKGQCTIVTRCSNCFAVHHFDDAYPLYPCAHCKGVVKICERLAKWVEDEYVIIKPNRWNPFTWVECLTSKGYWEYA